MTDEDVKYIGAICGDFAQDATLKFCRGQEEHGGTIWLKGGMLGHLWAELLDAIIYHATLRQQLQEVLCLMEQGRWGEAGPALRAILGPPQD